MSNINNIDENLREFVPDFNPELIPIKNLVSNQEYQRNLSIAHIKKVAESFDKYQVNMVKVSRRNGINYVFNGQHTIEIVALVSGTRDTPVWCMVFDDLEYEHEADIFANQLKGTRPLSPYEIFNANVEAGNDKQLIIKDLVESYGLVISPKKQPNGICAVSKLEEVYDKYGFHTLDRTLRLLCGTWEGDSGSFQSGFIMGVAILCHVYQERLKDELFKEKLGLITTKEIIRTAKERKNGSLGFSETMVLYYNKKSKFVLPFGDLYDKKKKKPMTIEDYITEELEKTNEETNDKPAE